MADDEASEATPAKKTTPKKVAAKKAPAKKAATLKATPKKVAKKAAPAKKAPGRPGKEKPEFGQELTSRERRCAMLSALGYTDGKIAKSLGAPFGIISTSTATNEILSACTKLGVGRNGLVHWAIDQLEGDALDRQRAAAERRRKQLRASGVLTPQRVQVAMLYASPEHADKTQAQIGALVTPEPITSQLVSRYLRDLVANIGPDGAVTKLIAILRLAPLSERRTDDVQPEETL